MYEHVWICLYFCTAVSLLAGNPKEERTKLFIYFPHQNHGRVLSGPAVTLRDDSIAHCVFPGDIGFVTFLSPTVPSIISVSIPSTSMVTLYHRMCHLDMLLASSVQSQKPFGSDADQTSKGAVLGWCSLSFHGVHTRIHSHFLTHYSTKKYSTITPFRLQSPALCSYFSI